MPISRRRASAPLIHIAVRFTTGQYSARPWGAERGCDRHEWPPSPYRIVRAAAAAWKYNLPDIAEDRFYAIVRRLASDPPLFCLPRAERTAGSGGDGRPPPWRIDPGQAVHIVWPGAALSGGERQTLSRIFGHVHYLGRTESWCEMRLGGCGPNDGGRDPKTGSGGCDQADAAPPPRRINCRPYDHEKDPIPGAVPARVIVPRPDVTMEDVYRKEFPSGEEVAGACPDGGMPVPYLIDREVAGPGTIGAG